jgi:hypothetical protein
MTVANTLAYHGKELFMTIKRFMVLAKSYFQFVAVLFFFLNLKKNYSLTKFFLTKTRFKFFWYFGESKHCDQRAVTLFT